MYCILVQTAPHTVQLKRHPINGFVNVGVHFPSEPLQVTLRNVGGTKAKDITEFTKHLNSLSSLQRTKTLHLSPYGLSKVEEAYL